MGALFGGVMEYNSMYFGFAFLYLLALGSPTDPIDPASYEAWCRTYEWKNIYGHDFVYAGPLFTHQMKLAQTPEAYDLFRSRKDGVLKIAIRP